MGSPLFGDFLIGANLVSGVTPPAFTPAAEAEDTNSDVMIVIYDHSDGSKKLVLSSAVKTNTILDISFSFTESGCASFSFSLGEKPSTEISYKNWIEIYLYKSATPWFAGTIEMRPESKATETEPQRYGGFGFFNQLDTCIIDKTYSADQPLEDIVTDIVLTFLIPKTDINYCSYKISPTFVRTVGQLRFQKVKAKTALQTIADIAQSFVFGVDEFRHFFFRPIDTSVRQEATFHVGKHLESFPIQTDPSKIINRVYVKGGEVTSGSNFLVTVNDSSSQTTYGIIEETMIAPPILNVTDATRWGNYQLTRLANPQKKAHIREVKFNQSLLKAEGKARVWIEQAGITDYEDLYIKKANYVVGPEGIMLDLELGELDQLVEQYFLEFIRQIKNQEALAEANVAELA